MSGKAPVASVYYVVVTVLERIRAMLADAGIEYREVRHEPTLTSEDSARARGEELRIGGKALLLKVNDEFRLFVLSAAKQLDSAAIKQRFGARKTRFASAEELLELTGLVPGSVPPFGRPLLPFDLYIVPLFHVGGSCHLHCIRASLRCRALGRAELGSNDIADLLLSLPLLDPKISRCKALQYLATVAC